MPGPETPSQAVQQVIDDNLTPVDATVLAKVEAAKAEIKKLAVYLSENVKDSPQLTAAIVGLTTVAKKIEAAIYGAA